MDKYTSVGRNTDKRGAAEPIQGLPISLHRFITLQADNQDVYPALGTTHNFFDLTRQQIFLAQLAAGAFHSVSR